MIAADPALSVVVLGYHNAPALSAFVARLLASVAPVAANFEVVLVVNDFAGSPDPTQRVAAELAAADPRIRVVARVKEGMMGWDLRSGLEEARGEAVAFIDGDGQMPAEDLARAYQRFRQGDVDLVKMVRVQRGDGLWRRTISAIYNLFFRLLFPGLDCADVNAKPKLLSRSALDRLRLTADGWFIDAELMIQARRLGLRVAELPTDFAPLEGRPSFVRPTAVLAFLRDLLVYRMREPRRRHRDN